MPTAARVSPAIVSAITPTTLSKAPPTAPPTALCTNAPVDDVPEGQWWLYMVRCQDRSLYTGITNDVARRMFMHATGRGARYTRFRGVVELAFLAAMPSPREARIAERSLKQWPVADKRALADAFDAIAIAPTGDLVLVQA